ncbi:hypothetical protein BGZ82_009845 [Podila clonocystis]|nr:hypothetical protein BGZ82_009845 [Podila clonocystis]
MTLELDSLGMDDTSSTAASLRFLLLGDVGVGKSAFVDAFVSTLAGVQSNQFRNESIPAPATSATQTPSPIHLEAVHVSTKPILQHDDTASPFDDHLGLIRPKVSIPARELTFATIPGYSSTANPSSVLTMTDDYLNHHLHSATSIFSPSIPSSQLAWFLIAGSRAHTLPTCAFYFVLYELKPIDILYMKMIHEKVNLIPIITKADTLSQNELWVLKRRMVRQLKLNGIKIHTFGHDIEAVERMVEQRQWGGAPFVVSTRRNSEGRLYKSELQDLVNTTLYERVRHLQEHAAQKVVAWKKAFGPVGNVVKSSVEQVWAEKETPKVTAPLRRRDTRPTGLATMTIASPTQFTAPSSVLQAQPSTTTSPPVPTPTLFSTAYAPPPSSVAYAPPPSSAPVDLANPTNFGLPAGNYAPPPNFTNGSVAQYTAPPSSLTTTSSNTGTTNGIKPAVLNMTATYNGSSIGLISPPPSSSNANPFTPSTAYAPPPRTSSSSASNQSRLTLTQNPTNFDRPSELIDDYAKTNGVTSPTQDSTNFMENYVVQPGSEASVSPQPAGGVEKVEIPNSEMSYQPSASETTTDLSNTLPAMAQLQQQPSFLTLPSFQTSGSAFLIPPSDLYQAAVMSTGGDYASNIPDIWEAAELGDLATVQLHLNNGVSPDQRNNSRSTLLHRTAWQGVQPYAVMKLLISYGANVNLVNENGNTVLQNVLMKHDDPNLIKLLLDNGAEAMVTNKEGMNTLEVAALFNKLESARYLLENDMSSSDPQSITNALQRARSPDKKAMKTLLKSWQGREGERKRFELADRLRGGPGGAGGQHAFLQQQPNQASDAASIRSFETTKGEGKSSKWLKLKF